MKNEDNKTSTSSTGLPKTRSGIKKAVYRTGKKAGDTAEIPSILPIITNAEYQNALTLNQNDTAYLQLVDTMDSLKYADGIMSYRGLPITLTDLNSLHTEKGIKKINLSLLSYSSANILDLHFNMNAMKTA